MIFKWMTREWYGKAIRFTRAIIEVMEVDLGETDARIDCVRKELTSKVLSSENLGSLRRHNLFVRRGKLEGERCEIEDAIQRWSAALESLEARREVLEPEEGDEEGDDGD